VSINDPLEIDRWHDLFIIKRGKETFYDNERNMITFETVDDAKAWAYAALGTIPLWEGEENEQ